MFLFFWKITETKQNYKVSPVKILTTRKFSDFCWLFLWEIEDQRNFSFIPSNSQNIPRMSLVSRVFFLIFCFCKLLWRYRYTKVFLSFQRDYSLKIFHLDRVNQNNMKWRDQTVRLRFFKKDIKTKRNFFENNNI